MLTKEQCREIARLADRAWEASNTNERWHVFVADALHAAMVEDAERLKPPPTSFMSNAHGHFIERCRCGIVLAQCRCPGPKDERVSNNPCSHVSAQEARDGE